jgi:hypothetical protein
LAAVVCLRTATQRWALVNTSMNTLVSEGGQVLEQLRDYQLQKKNDSRDSRIRRHSVLTAISERQLGTWFALQSQMRRKSEVFFYVITFIPTNSEHK